MVDRVTQMLKGVLDVCLLSVVAEAPSYGYEMVRTLRDRGLDLVSEGSIYPLLARLQRAGLIEGYLVEGGGGPARKYYRLSETGRVTLQHWREDWDRFRTGVEGVLGGGRSTT